ncbi:helix-turn-helix domain-containing protein [Paludibacterium paludis]|uniref:RobA family efflux pump transcriptional activator n=1 Tax=Paludibacterium paludis TaxID=1225769 RepID=A0A918P7G6_9NEIS|nr:helix-turn-helix domain-containing protein [Paludibacterium paludis]GGY27829.1 RobA family efflux pump transcriptional activator [Paludibacterium paludis]
MDSRVSESIRIIEHEIYRLPQEAFSSVRLQGKLASRLKLPPGQFETLFRSESGHSIKAYIRKTVIEAAAVHLSRTRVSLEGLSRRLGFASQQSFTRAFTRHYGLSPHRFRQKHSNTLAWPIWLTRPPVGQHEDACWPEQTLWARQYQGDWDERATFWRDFAASCRQAGLPCSPCFGVMYDDPGFTAQNRLRYLCAIQAPSRELPPPQWLVISIPGGAMATQSLSVSLPQMPGLYAWLLGAKSPASMDPERTGFTIECFDAPPENWESRVCRLKIAYPVKPSGQPAA